MHDNFAQAAKAAGMSYQQYAHHRAMEAKKRLGLVPCKKPFIQEAQKAPQEPQQALPASPPKAPPPPLPLPSVTIEMLDEEIKKLKRKLAKINRDAGKSAMYASERVWRQMHPETEPKTMEELARDVCERHGVTLTDLRSSRRDKPTVLARQEFWWRCRHETYRSYPEMGRFLRKDHTTALHGSKAYQRLLNTFANGGEPESRQKKIRQSYDIVRSILATPSEVA